ncbi:FkbM family methyltransferase [Erythrobacter sp. HA6-11]
MLLAPAKRLARFARSEMRLVRGIRDLRNQKDEVCFVHEGGTVVRMPPSKLSNLAPGEAREEQHRVWNFQQRPSKEVLLRKLVYNMLSTGFIDRSKAIIDIGSWLADNAIVWARLIEAHGGTVYAIDPSADNLGFGRRLAERNNVTNIEWVQAICSDEAGKTVYLDGDINHAEFDAEAGSGSQPFATTTLDEVVGTSNSGSIGLMHVDVEGFEEPVIKGAREIIEQSRPVVIFEQHISSEAPWPIAAFLEDFGYKTYMINEVLPWCRLDCRNFMAFHESQPPEAFLPVINHAGEADGIWYATIGDALIPLPAQAK